MPLILRENAVVKLKNASVEKKPTTDSPLIHAIEGYGGAKYSSPCASHEVDANKKDDESLFNHTYTMDREQSHA